MRQGGQLSVLKRLLQGIQTAEKQDGVLQWRQESQPDYTDLIALSRFGPFERKVFVRCYVSDEELSASDLQAFDRASKNEQSHMALVVGNGLAAMQEAALKGVALLTLEALANISEDSLPDFFKPAMLVYGFRFKAIGQQIELALPEEPPLLAHLMRSLRVVGPDIDTTPEKIVEQWESEFAQLATSTPNTFSVQLPADSSMIHPNDPDSLNGTPVNAFSWNYQLIPLSEFLTKEGLGVDPYLLGRTLEDELVKRNPKADPARMNTGFDTRLQFGRYYYNPNLQFSYYCESARKGFAKLVLVESYSRWKPSPSQSGCFD